MINEKERAVLNSLRYNSRDSLVSLSKKLNLPVSTIFEILKKIEAKYLVKHVSLVDFSKLGASIKVNFLISSKKKDELKKFLDSSNVVNTFSKSMDGYDFYVECIFYDMKELSYFKDQLDFFSSKFEEIFVLDELKKEGFLI